MKTSTPILLLLLCTMMAPAFAQNALPIAAEPLVYTIEGAVQGCGVRLTGGRAGATGRSAWFDVSVNVFRRGIALSQAIAYEFIRSDTEGDSRPQHVPVQSTWLKAGEGSATLGENVERRDSLVYSLAMEHALLLFEALALGAPFTIGVKPWGQRTDSVYSGVPALRQESREGIADCLSRLAQ